MCLLEPFEEILNDSRVQRRLAAGEGDGADFAQHRHEFVDGAFAHIDTLRITAKAMRTVKIALSRYFENEAAGVDNG